MKEFKVDYNGPWPRTIKVGKGGIVEVTKKSEIKGVNLKMLGWYHAHMTIERYKMWHHDHINRYKVEKPGKPPISYEVQKVGNKVYTMRAFPAKEREPNVTAGALRFQRGLTWHFHGAAKETPTGVSYDQSYWIGSKTPVIGPVWNWYLRKFVLPDFLKYFFIHQDEEGAYTEKFLPKLYSENKDKEK